MEPYAFDARRHDDVTLKNAEIITPPGLAGRGPLSTQGTQGHQEGFRNLLRIHGRALAS